MGEGVSHLRHLARTIREAKYAEGRWDEDFRARWVAILRDAGHAIKDPDVEVEPIHDRLDALAGHVAGQRAAADDLWPFYGSLLTSLRHIAVVVDDVASAREAREQGPGRTPA